MISHEAMIDRELLIKDRFLRQDERAENDMKESVKNESSSFLEACVKVLKESAGDSLTSVPDGLDINPHVTQKIIYDRDNDEWNYTPYEQSTPYTPNFHISNDGTVYVCDPGCPVGHDFMTTLECPAESREPLLFLEQASKQVFEKAKWIDTPLKSIFKGVYMQIPELLDTTEPLISISDPNISGDMPQELRDSIIKWLGVGVSGDLADPEYHTQWYWRNILEKHREWWSSKPKEKPHDEDLIWVPSTCRVEYRWHLEHSRSEWFCIDKHQLPVMALKVKRQHSLMYIHDLVRNSDVEAELIDNLLKHWSSVPHCRKVLDKSLISMPSTQIGQIKESIEFRAIRYLYKTIFHLSLNIPEEAKITKTLYKKRISILSAMHSEFLDDLESCVNPLPFFIDRPNHIFARSSGDLEKVLSGARLLDIMAKVVPLLVLEELQHNAYTIEGKELSQIFKLTQKRMSAGDWVGVTHALRKLTIPDDYQMFLRLLPNWPISSVECLVEARNRFHHPPNDVKTFIKVLDKHIPSCMESLRSSLQGIDFLFPESAKVLGNGTQITAKAVMGHDLPLANKIFLTPLKAERFPSEHLIAYNGKETIILRKFFKCQPQVGCFLNIGLFDGLEDNKPSFEYIMQDIQ